MRNFNARLRTLEEQTGATQRAPLKLFAALLEVSRTLRNGIREPALEQFRDWLASNAHQACPVKREVLTATATRLNLIALERACTDPTLWQPARVGWGAGSSLVNLTVTAARLSEAGGV